MKTKNSSKKAVIVLTSILAIGIATFLVHESFHSKLFLVENVELADPVNKVHEEESPVSAQTLLDLAAIPIGEVNLFALDLSKIESRLLTHPWIKEVVLIKHFPHTLSIGVIYREPKALVQGENGALSYIDASGKIFGALNLRAHPDLPMLSGMNLKDPKQMGIALDLIKSWDTHSLSAKAELADMTWNEGQGYKAHIWMPPASHATLYLGSEERQLDDKISQVGQVIDYLKQKNIPISQIRADLGKKIVVKIARGS